MVVALYQYLLEQVVVVITYNCVVKKISLKDACDRTKNLSKLPPTSMFLFLLAAWRMISFYFTFKITAFTCH